ncbi:MAG TPA: tRNA uridine(34) 5-carboxymethylaminomethyl modification radical SAM/GNAT enzyme Elp3 [Thermoflexia bacterium]|nr:tRNA uridine(34) 5-carboxymethylaminomethyl modification radical SAM/GNAT enzyme Elp3 [Thermoflexia bacterium]
MTKRSIPQPIDLGDRVERERVLNILRVLKDWPLEKRDISPLLRKYHTATGTYAKSQLLGAYRQLVEENVIKSNESIEYQLRGRPVRTISGVAPVAVLTESYPCPGECIFCPNQKDAPKSYLDGEPGVLRAIQYGYDPYAQTASRIQSLQATGHSVDKIELLVLGGTWSSYPEEYQEHFLLRCFDAMNEEPSSTLAEALRRNRTAPHRNVGLVIETRPDAITPAEVLRLREQGVTKVQLGVQSLDDQILELNRRGHTVAQTHRAIRLLRRAGFKIVAHWMPNLYGATPGSDLLDFARLWDDPAMRPDELKIYPTALLEGTELYTLWQEGKYQPYAEEDLIELVTQCKLLIQPYCRANRIMRDIPANYIVSGSKKSNLRQIVQQRMEKAGLACRCIRCREIRGHARKQSIERVQLETLHYQTEGTQEYFLQYLTPEKQLAGFLRLSLPTAPRQELPIPEIQMAAMIREVHVYGPAQGLGEQGQGGQHHGLGTRLLSRAAEIAQAAGFDELAVIAAVGTWHYYQERGFKQGELYPIRQL